MHYVYIYIYVIAYVLNYILVLEAPPGLGLREPRQEDPLPLLEINKR